MTYTTYIETTKHIAEISILARILRAESNYTITHREAIKLARERVAQ